MQFWHNIFSQILITHGFPIWKIGKLIASFILCIFWVIKQNVDEVISSSKKFWMNNGWMFLIVATPPFGCRIWCSYEARLHESSYLVLIKFFHSFRTWGKFGDGRFVGLLFPRLCGFAHTKFKVSRMLCECVAESHYKRLTGSGVRLKVNSSRLSASAFRQIYETFAWCFIITLFSSPCLVNVCQTEKFCQSTLLKFKVWKNGLHWESRWHTGRRRIRSMCMSA